MILADQSDSPIVTSAAQSPARPMLVVDGGGTSVAVQRTGIEIEGRIVSVADCNVEALEHVTHANPDTVVVRLMFPGVSGLELLRRLYDGKLHTTAMVLSAADECCTEQSEYRFGDVVIDRVRRTVNRGREPVELRPMELDLLLHLLDADGRAVSRAALMEKVWHYTPGIATRTVDQHIVRLRQKLEDTPTHPRHIITVRKVGYRIAL